MLERFDLGSYARRVTTSSQTAQDWFDRGLNWSYAFHHDAALRCFERAAEADPSCAMAYWGKAYAIGPNYNKPWPAFDQEEMRSALATARDALSKAAALEGRCSPAERALIDALAARYPAEEPLADVEAMGAWNDAYADAMRGVYDAFPEDIDVAALHADALMNRTPWAMWDMRTGEPAEGADTEEAQRVLEAGIARTGTSGSGAHPGLLHFYVHLMELSRHPEHALQAADGLRALVPDAGHLVHMPTHIDVLCGDYHNVVITNQHAIEADNRVYAGGEGSSFYTLYRCHNYHFKVYGAMFLGQRDTALEAADAMNALITEDLLLDGMADWLEGFLSMKLHVMVRFGMWQEILDLPFPADPELYSVTTAMLRYAKGVAHASRGEVEAARADRDAFRDALERVPDTRTVFNNRCVDILAVADAMLDGELTYREGDFEGAFARLRHAVALADGLPYDEPWAWMQPVRHALGALLLEQGRLAEAEQVYREDLGLAGDVPRAMQHPDNVWSLHGLVECLHRAGNHAEHHALQPRLELAAARADVPIEASCYCRVGAPASG